MAKDTRKHVAILFGGRSVEHEISIITGLQLIKALDTALIHPIPVYIAQDGRWFSDTKLLDKTFYKSLPGGLTELPEVTLLPKPGVGGLTILNAKEGETQIIPIDVFFPAFHGQYGEDGCIQGLFEMADVTYTGSKVLGLSASMNKYICKSIARDCGIPVLPCALVKKIDLLKDPKKTSEAIASHPALKSFPLFIKPCNLGSSVGVSRANSPEELLSGLLLAFKYDEEAIVEPCVSNLMEINISVLDADEPYASVVEIPVSQSGVLSYEEKYMRGGSKKTGDTSQGMASLTRVIDPPDLDTNVKAQVTKHALELYKTLKCSGSVRLDFMMDTAKNELYFNELNSLPGSLAFYLWAKTTPQVLYTDMLNRIIDRAIELKNRERNLSREIGFKALFK